MPEESLDHFQIDFPFAEPGGEGVAKDMRGNFVAQHGLHVPVENDGYRILGKALRVPSTEDGPGAIAQPLVGGQLLTQPRVQGDLARLLPLASTDCEHFALKIDVAPVEVDGFLATQAAVQE